jgi:hypothetical protein
MQYFRPGDTAAITELAMQKFSKVKELYRQLDSKVSSSFSD